MHWSAVYFDLDGTLLDQDSTVPPVVVDAIARVRARGIRVGIATGRRATTTRPHARTIGVDAPCVLFNGAVVVDDDLETTLFRASLPLDPTRAVIERVLSFDVHVAVYVDERMLTDVRAPHPRVPAGSIAHAAREPIDLARLDQDPVKLLFVDEPAKLARVRAALIDEALLPPGAHLVRSAPRFLELLPDGVHKGSGLGRCAARLGVEVDTIVAFGDDENDREMLALAGLSFAMGHAPQTVRDVVDGVVGSPDCANEGAALAAKLDELFA
jgi:Cof subfamily protein (haloacid dehalogenase superfamily)